MLIITEIPSFLRIGLSLPSQHYYAQNHSLSFAPYTQTQTQRGQAQGQIPAGHVIPDGGGGAQSDSRSQEPSLQDNSEKKSP